jgi:Ankyrin repeats (3 copies)
MTKASDADIRNALDEALVGYNWKPLQEMAKEENNKVFTDYLDQKALQTSLITLLSEVPYDTSKLSPQADQTNAKQNVMDYLLSASYMNTDFNAALQLVLNQNDDSKAINPFLPKINSLIKASPNVLNTQNNQGNTAWHIIAQADNLPLLTSLLDNSNSVVDLNIKNNQGKTPLDLALDGVHIDVAIMLISKGAQLGENLNMGGRPKLLEYFNNPKLEKIESLFNTPEKKAAYEKLKNTINEQGYGAQSNNVELPTLPVLPTTPTSLGLH